MFTLENCLFGEINTVKMLVKKSICIVATEQHLTEQVHVVLVMVLLKMLKFLVLIIVHHLILIIPKITFHCQVKDQLMILMAASEEKKQRKNDTEKCFIISFCKAKTSFWLSLHYNCYKSYLFVNGKAIEKFKANNRNVDFPAQFFLGNIYTKFETARSMFTFFEVNYMKLVKLKKLTKKTY